MKQFFKIVFATMLGTFLSLVVLFLFSLAVVVALVSGLSDEKVAAIEDHTVLLLDFKQPVVERTSKNPLENFDFNTMKSINPVGIYDFISAIENAAKDKKVDGIFLDLSDLIIGPASLEEIRDAVLEFNKSGKFSIAYSEAYSQKSYYLASACRKVYLNPQGDLEWKGLGSEMMFVKGALEKLDVEPQIIRHGKFKGAVEPLILDKLSSENREQIREYASDIWQHFLGRIAQARKLNTTDLQDWADGLKVKQAEDAKSLNMVDKLVYRDEVLDEIRLLSKADQVDKIEWAGIRKYIKAPSKKKSVELDKIAIVYAGGSIGSGESSGGDMGSETIVKALRKAREDKKVKAVVFRVNSPGGSALASDVIWREVSLIKKVKPIVVSMGDVAASGGYYISAAASKIVAQPLTLTGSIGVFGVLFNAEGLLKNKLGLSFDTVLTARHADFGTISRPLHPEERAYLQYSVEHVYSVFVKRVSDGRNISEADVDSIGQGRVWSGIDAKERKLVDELGGIKTALNAASTLAGMKDYRITELPEEKDPLEELFKEGDDVVKTWVMRAQLGEHYQLFRRLDEVKKLHGVQALLPAVPVVY